MQYIYGPVDSKRLGASLGVSITPFKYCQIDCVYCQLKKTTNFTLVRKPYIKIKDVLFELEQFFKNNPGKRVDYVTISGSGEPLLNSKIKDLISGIRKITRTPIALITNSILLIDPKVRNEILDVDLILPSLDAYTQDVFDKICRPMDSHIKVKDLIDALVKLRKEFRGKIWLEIMLVKGVNDDLEYLRKFKKIVDKINSDIIQLNTPRRQPAEPWVKIPPSVKLKKIKSIFGDRSELI